MSGYLHPDYAISLAEFGQPRHLPMCNGWLLTRQISDSKYVDGTSCYPLFTCEKWEYLQRDIEEYCHDLVSVALVIDPFGEYDQISLQQCFPDKVMPFKEHFVIDLQEHTEKATSKHHRYYARKALNQVSVEKCTKPSGFLEDWLKLYNTLIVRQNIKGIRAFSRQAFTQQLVVPGLVMFCAKSKNEVVGAHLWYVQGDVAYSHLAASSEVGYEMMVSYALYWSAIDYFKGHVRWLHLGAGAGVRGDASDGLSRFKQGWATDTRTAYFCGRIFNHDKYHELSNLKNGTDTSYFPAYRVGEYG